MPDLSVFKNQKTLADYIGANERQKYENQLMQAQAQKAVTDNASTRAEELSKKALIKKMQGLPLTPEEDAQAQYAEAKLRQVGINSVTGDPYSLSKLNGASVQPTASPQSPAPTQSNPQRPLLSPMKPRDLPPEVPGTLLGNVMGVSPQRPGESTKTYQERQKLEMEQRNKAETEFPKNEAQAKLLIDQVTALKTHPGMQNAVGAKSLMGGGAFMNFGAGAISGSDAADFVSRLDQVKGAQFMEAYAGLKGGGQITEVEGQKATAAISRMSTAQSEKEFNAAADEFIAQTQKGMAMARAKAEGRQYIPGEESAPNGGQPQTKTINGVTYIKINGEWHTQ